VEDGNVAFNAVSLIGFDGLLPFAVGLRAAREFNNNTSSENNY